MPDNQALTLSVVIVTWNGLHLLQPCLAALAVQTLAHELVIVDNGSTDGTVAWVQQSVPTATLISLPANRGFAAGNNLGIAAARGDLVTLLNNDTLAAPTALAELAAPFVTRPRLGATAGVLVFAHASDYIASAGITVARDGVHRDWLAAAPCSALPSAPVPIFGASGGAVCFRRTALDDVGLFAERFFAYLEDADLAWRLRLRDWETVLVPTALIQHVYSATSGEGSPWKQRLLARNRWWVILRCWPWSLILRCLPALLWYDLLAVAYALLGRQPAIITGRLAAWRDLGHLLRERRFIQQRRSVPAARLVDWLTPPLGLRATLAAAAALRARLATR